MLNVRMLIGQVGCVCALAMSVSAFAETVPERQQKAPQKLVTLVMEEGEQRVVYASKHELNVIFTPFNQPRVITDDPYTDFQASDGKIYFRPASDEPIGIFLTEKDVSQSPVLKLTIMPSDLPVGQQIKVEAPGIKPGGNKKTPEQTAVEKAKVHDYVGAILKSLALVASTGEPDGFSKSTRFTPATVHVGNALVAHSRQLVSSAMTIDVYDVINRGNETLTLSEVDFFNAPAISGANRDNPEGDAVAVAFFPLTVVEAGRQTKAFVVRRVAK